LTDPSDDPATLDDGASPVHGRGSRAEGPCRLPLYVDLDGSLIYSDLLFESFLGLVKRNPLYAILCFVWLFDGIPRLKAEIAKRVDLDPALLPYNPLLLEFLRGEHATGRRLILASASNHKYVQAVARHLGIFHDTIASDEKSNLKAAAKLSAIQAGEGADGFAYAANARDDLVIWARADDLILVNARPLVVAKALRIRQPSLVIPPRKPDLLTYLKAMRLHQWAKNLLLFVPLLASHNLDGGAWLPTLMAFVAFGLCASATYIINDLLDLPSDRQHPRKRFRPFASAMLTIPAGMIMVLVLLPLSFALALLVSPAFLAMLLAYSVLTLVYSLSLKRVTLVDVIVLALLYTYRVVAGAVASGLVLSNWLLAVSLFIFLSLALIKRCAELQNMSKSGESRMAGRSYRLSDLPYLVSMGISSGFLAIVVFALYIENQAGVSLYPHADLLWLMLPVLMYWIMRMWIKTARMEIHDDPLIFVITDPANWIVGVVIGCIALAASTGIFL